MILRSESRERNRVLDVDRVVLGARNQRPVLVSEWECVDLDGTPGHDLAHEDPLLPVALYAVAGQGSVAFYLESISQSITYRDCSKKPDHWM